MSRRNIINNIIFLIILVSGLNIYSFNEYQRYLDSEAKFRAQPIVDKIYENIPTMPQELTELIGQYLYPDLKEFNENIKFNINKLNPLSRQEIIEYVKENDSFLYKFLLNRNIALYTYGIAGHFHRKKLMEKIINLHPEFDVELANRIYYLYGYDDIFAQPNRCLIS